MLWSSYPCVRIILWTSLDLRPGLGRSKSLALQLPVECQTPDKVVSLGKRFCPQVTPPQTPRAFGRTRQWCVFGGRTSKCRLDVTACAG